VVLAPMAGGPSTPELAAAVCRADGLGFLAAGYLSAEQLATHIERLRELTGGPFGINLFVVGQTPVDDAAVDAYVRSLERDASRLGVQVGRPRFDDDSFDSKLEVVLDARAAVVSFTFGCPPAAIVRAVRSAGSQVWVTVTSAAEAQLSVAAGADAVIAQGAQAGGHRGSFADDGGQGTPDTLDLVASIRARLDVPVVAAGGIASAQDARGALAAGAAAVQAGTAFLLADEAGTHPVLRAAVGSDVPTAFTRAFTGRTARGIANAFMADHPSAPAAYPHIHHATAPIRAAARATGDPDRVNLWAGTRHRLARPGPAADVVGELAQGISR
jgi:nitronate monooxygenase